MYTATIVRDTAGTYHIRIGKKGPDTSGDVEVIDTLHQRDDENYDAFKFRCQEYVRDLQP